MKISDKILLSIMILIILFGAVKIVESYSTYGTPSAFGNETDTTCNIGGDYGIVNCTHNASFEYYLNKSWDLDWINPENVFDIDDEDIESDLNTYVDIAGDIMAGTLAFGNFPFTITSTTQIVNLHASDLTCSACISSTEINTKLGNTTTEIQAVAVGGEVTGTVSSITLNNDALDDQYYDSESDITALLDDNYVSRNVWTDIDNYPGACTGFTVVQGLGDTLSCYTPQLLGDTSPQLGGYLDANGFDIGSTTDEIEDIYIKTNKRTYYGDNQEASIYYNGTDLVGTVISKTNIKQTSADGVYSGYYSECQWAKCYIDGAFDSTYTGPLGGTCLPSLGSQFDAFNITCPDQWVAISGFANTGSISETTNWTIQALPNGNWTFATSGEGNYNLNIQVNCCH